MNKRMKVIQNPDKEFAKSIKTQLKANNGYCPCVITKTPESKCMCKEFRDMIANGETGTCHCGLYIAQAE